VSAQIDAPLQVAVADDAYLSREVLSSLLAAMPGIDLAAVCNDGDALLDVALSGDVDVAVIDMRMPPNGDTEGIRVARVLAAERPAIGVVVLSQFEMQPAILRLFEDVGVGRAYLVKDRIADAGELETAIRTVAYGDSMFDPVVVRMLIADQERRHDSRLGALTLREREILASLACGASNAAIAAELVLTKRAVEKHVGSIFAKLDLPPETVVSRRVRATLIYLSETARAV
jgi:DNA-binding NarL/FixJ family response regulator